MAKTAIDAPRFDAYWIAPEKLKLILDKASPFYQSRAEEPPDAGLVLSMKRGGFLANQAISVFKDGPDLCVLDGRRRTTAAVEANRQLVAENREPLRVAVILKKGTEGELYAVQAAANENRSDVSDVERAKEISKLMAYGKTVEEAGEVLGFNKAKAQRILALLDCAVPVQRAVEAKQIPATAAVKLAKLDRKEQVVELEKLIAESGGERVRGARVAKAVRKATGAAALAERPSRKAIQAMLDHKALPDAAKAALRWALDGSIGGCIEAAINAEVIGALPPLGEPEVTVDDDPKPPISSELH